MMFSGLALTGSLELRRAREGRCYWSTITQHGGAFLARDVVENQANRLCALEIGTTKNKNRNPCPRGVLNYKTVPLVSMAFDG
jgi:hypothetical protein